MEVVKSKDSGIAWIGRIPEHWNNYSFKRVFNIIYRYPTYYDIEYVSEGIPEIRGEALNKFGLIDKLETERYISSETNAQFPQTQLAEGDIIISVRGTMGKIGFVDQRYIGANITANLLRLSPKSGIADGRFLRWFFMGDYFLQRLEATSPQTTIKTVTMPQLSKISLLSPPLAEQRRIAAYLDITCTAIDTATGASRQGLSHKDVGLIKIPLPSIKAQREAVARIEEHDAKHRNICISIKTQIETLRAYRKSLIHECVTGKRRVTEADVALAGMTKSNEWGKIY